MIRVAISTNNNAFNPKEQDGWRQKVAWILHDLADRLITGQALPVVLRDFSGNQVRIAEQDLLEPISATADERETM